MTLIPSTNITYEDMFLLKPKILGATLPYVHFDPDSIQSLDRLYDLEQQVFFFQSSRKVFLKLEEEMIAKMLGIPAQGIDITDKGLDQEFNTWAEDDELELMKNFLGNLVQELKFQFPIATQSFKPFFHTLTSLFSVIFGLADDAKMDESIFLAI